MQVSSAATPGAIYTITIDTKTETKSEEVEEPKSVFSDLTFTVAGAPGRVQPN